MTKISEGFVDREKISIVVPFFNEQEGIEIFYSSLCQSLDLIVHYDFEMVCVNDGSTDKTLDRLKALVRRDPRFIVLDLSRNFGKEIALTAGLDSATGVAAIPMDADLQDPPELIGRLIAEWENGYEVVLAQRADRSSDSLLKSKTAEIFYKVHNYFSTLKIPENVGDFRLMDRVVLDALRQLPEQQRFMKGLFAWVGFRTTSVSYQRQLRATGKSQFSGWKLWNLALEGITSFSTSPLKFWTYLGLLGASTSLLYAIFIVVRTALFGADVPGYPSLITAIMFFGSVQLIGIGMLGEYIGRIYMETKRRPLYFIRERYQNIAKD